MALALERPAVVSTEAAPTAPDHRWEASAVVAVLVLAGLLRLVGLDQEGFGNTYYAAAVWSILQNLHALVFASFDAGGFVSVDKPPVGLWIQVLSAKLLGFNGVALLLPQALAGVAAVGVTYWLVRRAFGPLAGLLAAAALAVTPISVVTDRNNTMDAALVLSLLLAVWAVSVAAERGSLRALLVGAALVGVAFNIKMLQADPIVPGLGLAYALLAARLASASPAPAASRRGPAGGVAVLVGVRRPPAGRGAPVRGIERQRLGAQSGAWL